MLPVCACLTAPQIPVNRISHLMSLRKFPLPKWLDSGVSSMGARCAFVAESTLASGAKAVSHVPRQSEHFAPGPV